MIYWSLKGAQTTLLDLDWFFDILDLEMKNTQTTRTRIDFIIQWTWID